MSENSSSDKSMLLSDISPYVYGTTRLGDTKIPFDDRVAIARMAVDAGIWFHTSHTYSNALDVIRVVLDQDRTKVPKFIVKLIGSSVDEIKDVVQRNLQSLGIEGLELGQLCLGGQIAEDFATGGNCYQAFSNLKAERL